MQQKIQTMNCPEPNFAWCCLIVKRKMMLVGAPGVLRLAVTVAMLTRAINE
jgi:hypothetical protein